jgi:hypothetical protein
MLSRPIAHRRVLIHQIPIRIMLNHKPTNIPPIIKNLTTQNMSPDTPNTFILLLCEPLMTQQLRIEIMNFVRGVMNVSRFVRDGGGHEESVVVDRVLAAVDGREETYFLAGGLVGRWVDGFARDIEDIGGVEVEVPSVPVHLGGEVVAVETEVTEL